jgi:iron complex outermembrane receptor protein
MFAHRRPIALAIGSAFFLPALLPAPALAEESAVMPDVVVSATRMETAFPLNSESADRAAVVRQLPYTSDTARLLSDLPGYSTYTGGGVSSLPSIRGMADDRVRVNVDGMDLQSACGNHMNPAMSYVDPSNVGRVSMQAGITPVSAGGDSIAGTIVIDSITPIFAQAGQGTIFGGSLSGFVRSNGNANGGSIKAYAATESLSIAATAAYSKSGNYKDGNGQEVKSTQYDAQNQALSIALRGEADLFVVNFGHQNIPYQGFPNARMDMTSNESNFVNGRYLGTFGWGTLDARAYYQHVKHEMGFLKDKGGEMPMNTDGENFGYSLKAEIPLNERDTLRIGNEFNRFNLDDWWPPVAGSMMMGPGTFQNINNGHRERIGTFVEWEARWAPQWITLLGARHDYVTMNTGDVAPYDWRNPIPMGGMGGMGGMGMANPDAPAATAFNAQDRKRSDNLFDLTALTRYLASETNSYELGYARKSRAPNLYERYAWGNGAMAMNMNGWFGDGNGYVGNLELKPEVAHTVNASAIWNNAAKTAELRVTPYYSYVNDYIDVNRCAPSVGGACKTAGNQTASTGFVFLQFANHDARIYGIDVSGRLPLGEPTSIGEFSARGMVGYVNGKNLDTDDNLYHMMPFNAKLAADHRLGQWSNTLEFQLVAAKDDVQRVRNEVKTAGYGLVNLRTSYQWTKFRIDAGVENLFDKNYDLPLGGAYLGERPMLWGIPVAGMGRNFYLGATLQF